MTRLWVLYAVLASATWGFNYVVGEVLYGRLSFLTVLAIGNVAGGLVLGWISWQYGNIVSDLRAISGSTGWWLIAFSGSWMLAEFLLALAITHKNAALASMIQISYPIFVVMFSAIIIGGRPLTPSVVIGGFMILTGASLIGWKVP